ncbi:MAG: hypothetical protein BA869_03845 [Desulfuromonadales bacterium C00003107]|nr:MAG: hypothetical protein BA869_03845 [Desulfuromonadales bacterium C00003107]
MTDRNEKLAARVQIFENLRANSRAIWRKLSRIWADQAILQLTHGKHDSLLVKAEIAFPAENLGDGHNTLPIRAINMLHTTECRSAVIITR